MVKTRKPVAKLNRFEQRVKALQHSGRLLYAVLALTFSAGIGVATLYQAHLSRLPDLTIAIKQDRKTVAIAEQATWKASNKAQLALASKGPVIATIDEAQGPSAVALVLQQMLLILQLQIVQTSRHITIYPIQRDIVKRSIMNEFLACSAEAQKLYPIIHIDLDISNAGGATVLWLAEAQVHFQRNGTTNIAKQELDIGDDRRIKSAGEKHFSTRVIFSIDSFIDLQQIATESLTNLLETSEIARSNFWPFIKHVTTSREEDINAVMNTAPLFAHPSVFSPCFEDFRHKMYAELRNTEFHLELILRDSHDKTYRAKVPIELQVKEGVERVDEWSVVTISAIHELRMMDERLHALGLSWRALGTVFETLTNNAPDANASH